MKDSYHPIVVVGAGPAGCAAAVQCTRLGTTPLVLDKTGKAGGLIANANLVENYPGLEEPIDGPEMVLRLNRHLERFSVSVHREVVCSVENHQGRWRLNCKGETVTADSLILCPGTTPKELPKALTHGLSQSGFFYEVSALLSHMPEPKKVVIIGGGEASFDYALNLSSRGGRVNLLIRGETPKVTGRLLDLVDTDDLISVHTSHTVETIRERDGTVEVFCSCEKKGATFACDAVLAAIGRRSALPSIYQVDTSGGISLTHSPGLFICGDARFDHLGQAGMAVGDGLRAAAAAVEHAGKRKK